MTSVWVGGASFSRVPLLLDALPPVPGPAGRPARDVLAEVPGPWRPGGSAQRHKGRLWEGQELWPRHPRPLLLGPRRAGRVQLLLVAPRLSPAALSVTSFASLPPAGLGRAGTSWGSAVSPAHV